MPRFIRSARRRVTGATSLLLLGSLIAGCAPPTRMVHEPRLPPCRGVVNGASRPLDVDLAWLAPASAADRRAHAEWCGTVGPVVIASHPSRGSGHTAALRLAAEPIAIVSWNTHAGGADLLALVTDLRAGRWSAGRPIRHMVLLLQEVFRRGSSVPPLIGEPPDVPDAIVPPAPPSGRLGVVAAAERLGMALLYAPSMRNGSRRGGDVAEDRGSAILSTLPLADFRVVELPFERQRRVAVVASIRLPDEDCTKVHVASVHLDNRTARRRMLVFSPAGRTRQAKGLIAALPSAAPTILGGDFNTWVSGREGALVELRRVFPQTPRAEGLTFSSVRLDYLFFRLPPGWRASSLVIEDKYGSDHRAVLGLVDVADGAETGEEALPR